MMMSMVMTWRVLLLKVVNIMHTFVYDDDDDDDADDGDDDDDDDDNKAAKNN